MCATVASIDPDAVHCDTAIARTVGPRGRGLTDGTWSGTPPWGGGQVRAQRATPTATRAWAVRQADNAGREAKRDVG